MKNKLKLCTLKIFIYLIYSPQDLNEMSERIQQLESEQNCMQKNVESFQSDIDSLLELIKRGRIENDWNLDGLTFHRIQPSDIPAPSE